MKRRAAYILIVAFVSAFGWFVWPTPYRYYRIVSSGSEVPMRENRFTGTIESVGRVNSEDKNSHWEWLK
jgi:hypothetical protein